MHTGSHMLNYTRHYFVNFPDVMAEDSQYVQLGEPIGTPLSGIIWPDGSGLGFGEDGDVDEFGNPIFPNGGTTPDDGGATTPDAGGNGGYTGDDGGHGAPGGWGDFIQ